MKLMTALGKAYFKGRILLSLLKGTYVLLLENIHAVDIKVGSLDQLRFDKGFYAYVGSMFGPGELKARIGRYFAVKRRHWHIDYILDHIKIFEVYVLPEKDYESRLAKAAVRRFKYVKDFGCSDRKNDVSHLICLRSERELGAFLKLVGSLGFKRFEPSSETSLDRCYVDECGKHKNNI